MPRLLLPALVLFVMLVLPSSGYAQQLNAFNDCQSFASTFAGWTPSPNRNLFTGPVHITCDDMDIFADEVEIVDVDDQTRLIYARGNVLMTQPGLRVSAESAEFNSRTRYGRFVNASGYARISENQAERSMFGTAEPHVDFWGKVVERTGPETYRFENGGFTACTQPTPRWEIGGSSGSVTLKKHVVLRNAVLKVKNVPLGYLPLMYYPLSEDDRSTGVLIPSYSTSTVKGWGVSNAFFLVLGRSQDATFYHDWFSKSGQGLGGEYRYVAAPGSQGEARFYMLDEKARFGTDGITVERPERRSYDIRGSVNQALPRNFRLIGNVNYFTDVTTRQLYDQSVFESSSRQRAFNASLSGNVGRARLSTTIQQRDYFFGEDNAQRNGVLPSVDLQLPQRPIGRSRIYVGASGNMSYLVSQLNLNDPDTDRSLLRIDASPVVRASLSTLPFLNVTTNASVRYTRWQKSLDPETRLPVDVPLNRQLLEVGATVKGPILSRVFNTDNGYAERLKHLIEPTFNVRWFSPFEDLQRVVVTDGTDGIVGGTGTFTYGVTNRLLARRASGGTGPGVIRDILTVSVTQTYYTKAEAATYDYQNQSIAAGNSPFSPLRIVVQARPTDSLSADFRTEIDPEFHTPRQYSVSGRYSRPRAQFNGGWSKRRIIPGLPGYDNPDFATHLLNGSTSLQSASNAFGGTYEFNFDILNTTMLRQRIVAYYNAQCCGVQFDYQAVSYTRFGLASVPSDRRFGVSFTLAGIGSFSNPFGSFGGGEQR